MRRSALDAVYELAKRDSRVVFIGSDLGAGTMDKFRKEMPQRFFMEGVAEQNIIGMAAGLAMDGFIPYVNTIATFLTRRCYEQVAVDLCLHNLPVRLIANGGGMVYAPLGPTHIAIEDMGILRALPNMTVTAPTDAPEAKRLVEATLDVSGPVYIRLAKGGDPVVSRAEDGFTLGKSILLRKPSDVLFIANGVMVHRCLEASDLMSKQGVGAGVLNMHTLKPLDEEGILAAARSARLVVTVEEHTLIGGLGSAVAEVFMRRLGRRAPELVTLGIPDVFTEKYGSQDSLLAEYGLQPAQIATTATAAIGRMAA
jgi:transketolase